MQRQTRRMRRSVTTYDRDRSILSHWEVENETYVPLHGDPEVFEAFKAAIYAGENIIDVAQRFDTDHCVVLHWKHKLVGARHE